MLFFSVVCVIFLQKKNQSEWDIALSIFLVFFIIVVVVVVNKRCCRVMHAVVLNISLISFSFCKKLKMKRKRATQFTLQS